MTTTLTPPAPLLNTKVYTRSEYKAWQSANHDYQVALQAEQERAAKQAEAKAATANRLLTDDEYDAAAAQREAERIERAEALAAEEKAKQDATLAYLESSPDVAEISTSNPFHYTQLVCHWANRGYTFADDTEVTVFPHWYAVKLKAPAAKKAVK